MISAHLLLAALAATGFAISAWMLGEAGRVARAPGDVDRLAILMVPMTALVFVVVGTLTVREVLVAGQVGTAPVPPVRPDAARFISV